MILATLFFLLFTVCHCNCSFNIKIDFEFVDGAGNNHYKDLSPFNPALNSIWVSNISSNTNYTTFRIHPNREGIYSFSLPSVKSKYKLAFNSNQIWFTKSNEFVLSIDPSHADKISQGEFNEIQFKSEDKNKLVNGLALYQLIPGNHEYLENQLDNLITPSSITNNSITISINGPSLGMLILSDKSYLTPERAFEFIKQIPILGNIFENKFLSIGLGIIFGLILLPRFIMLIDPGAKERILQAQLEAQKKKQ
ncbi:hypothetical protein DAMA08_034760 [Martiniozyma asiatica (nom. inval.)]|nr:hypothetical protein DAMA08_034760 [Martiniozyma asiatica]